MLCTFTTEHGNFIVPSDDIRAIEDRLGGAIVTYGKTLAEASTRAILGTAIENRDRIQQEELDLIDRVNQHHLQAQTQARLQQQMMAQLPRVERGKQIKK